MITNQILTTASSAVYQARALQQQAGAAPFLPPPSPPISAAANAAGIGKTKGYSDNALATESSHDLELLRKKQPATIGFGDIYTSQLSLSSLAFALAFGIGKFRQEDASPAPDQEVAGQGYRQYRAAQDNLLRPESDETNLEGVDAEGDESEIAQQILPPLRNFRKPVQESLTGRFSDSAEFVLHDDFAQARFLYTQATELRKRAFASPPSINLLG